MWGECADDFLHAPCVCRRTSAARVERTSVCVASSWRKNADGMGDLEREFAIDAGVCVLACFRGKMEPGGCVEYACSAKKKTEDVRHEKTVQPVSLASSSRKNGGKHRELFPKKITEKSAGKDRIVTSPIFLCIFYALVPSSCDSMLNRCADDSIVRSASVAVIR